MRYFLFIIAILLANPIFAQVKEIAKDGNYASSQRIFLSEDKNTVYNITATIELEGSLYIERNSFAFGKNVSAESLSQVTVGQMNFLSMYQQQIGLQQIHYLLW